MSQTESFGEFIKALRLSRKLLLRHVAAALDVDPSLLSRIERGEKRISREQLKVLCAFLKADEDELVIHWLSDRVVYELRDEKLALKAMIVAERRINYLVKNKKNKR